MAGPPPQYSVATRTGLKMAITSQPEEYKPTLPIPYVRKTEIIEISNFSLLQQPKKIFALFPIISVQ